MTHFNKNIFLFVTQLDTDIFTVARKTNHLKVTAVCPIIENPKNLALTILVNTYHIFIKTNF